MNTGKRTLAFQVSEEFYNEVQEYIKANKMKLKEFGITAMRRMLNEVAPSDSTDPAADSPAEQE